MGAWGYYEHENDTFSDFMADDTTTVQDKMKEATPAQLVGIYNVIKPKTKFPKKYVNTCIAYLTKEMKNIDPGWVDADERLIILKKQLSNITKYKMST